MTFLPTLSPSITGTFVGSCIGHIGTSWNQIQETRSCHINHSRRIASYALAAASSYITAWSLAPQEEIPPRLQHASIALASYLSMAIFLKNKKHRACFATAFLTPIVISKFLPRPIASFTTPIAIFTADFFISKQKENHLPSSPSSLPPIQETMSRWIVIDMVIIAALSTAAAIEGMLYQSRA